MYTSTEGIVLKQVKITGGRRMIHIFTQKYGKVSVGTNVTERSNKSKAALSIRPFTYGIYEIFKNRDYYNLNGSEVKKSFYGIGEDLDKYAVASYALELTDKVLPDELPQPRLFSILIGFMEALEKRTSAFETLLLAYIVKLIGTMGSSPMLDECGICGKKEVKFFSVTDGGMICLDCQKKITENTREEARARLIYEPDFDIVNTLRYLEAKPFSAFDKIALAPKISEKLKSMMRDYVFYHLDVDKLKSESIYDVIK